MVTVIRFAAILFTGLALVAPAAHLFEMLNKMPLSQSDYFIVQRIYNGWWMLGLFLPLAFLANLAAAWTQRRDRVALVLSLGAAACVLLNLTIFFVFTQPANAATQNWTVQPDNWAALRQQWEYSHAVNAGVMLAAFCLAISAALRRNLNSPPH
jgi:hypothetical protein